MAIKFSLEGFPPLIGASLRFTLAVIIVGLYIFIKKIPLRINRGFFWLLLLTGTLIYLIDYGLIYWAEQYINAGVAAIFFATFSLFTAIFSNFIFKSETFRWNKYIGIVIGFVGISTVFYDQLIITKFNTMVVLASLAVIISAASGAISTVIIKKHLSRLNTFTLTFYQLVFGTVLLIIGGLIAENPQHIKLNPRPIGAVIYLGILGSAVAFVVYFKLLKQMSAISLSLLIYIIPIIAVITDFIFFDEMLHLRSIIGMGIIFMGIWITQMNKKRITQLFRFFFHR